nr:SgcJ/EcaC family oxidoreductase [Pseudomonadota bacterium]
WWKSRAEMQQKLTRMFATAFRNSTLTFTDVSVKFLTPDIAIAHARWTMTGEQIPPGQPVPDKGIQTLVMTKHAGKWLIAEFQNTVSKPEPPFLAKPVSTPGAASSTSR